MVYKKKKVNKGHIYAFVNDKLLIRADSYNVVKYKNGFTYRFMFNDKVIAILNMPFEITIYTHDSEQIKGMFDGGD